MSMYDSLMEMVKNDPMPKGVSDVRRAGIYVMKEDMYTFMGQNDFYTLTEAENAYAKAVGLNEDAIILTERAPERDAMSVSQAQKFMNDVVRASRSKTDSKKEIDARIAFLKSVVKRMEDARDGIDGNDEHIKFVLKGLIPFNGLARLIDTQHDVYGFLANFGELVIPGGSLIIRAVTYKKMMDSQIAKTNAAIQYLEQMKKTLK